MDDVAAPPCIAPSKAAGAVNVVDTSALTRRVGAVLAVSEVSLSVGSAEMFGLIGPNGAGKQCFRQAQALRWLPD